MKCYYCENEATRKDYRSNNGVLGKVIVCDDCFHTNDEGIREIEYQMSKSVEEIFNYYELNSIVDKAMDEFWDTVNAEVDKLGDDFNDFFEIELGIPAHPTTIEKWREKYFNLIQAKVKEQL